MGQLWGRAKDPDSALHLAIKAGRWGEVVGLVGEQVEGAEPPLCLAARLGQARCLEELLQVEALDPGQEDKSGFSPLILAIHGVACCGTDAVQVLLASTRVDVNQLCKSGTTAFEMSLISGKLEVAEMLLELPSFDARSAVCRRAWKGADEPALVLYSRRLNLPAVRLLVRAGHALEMPDAEGRTALWHATTPNRPARRNLNLLVRRVRGDLEAGVRTELVRLLVGAGARVGPEVVANLGSSLPSLQAEAEGWRRSPPSLRDACRAAVWEAARRGRATNLRAAVDQLREHTLPATLTDYLLFHTEVS